MAFVKGVGRFFEVFFLFLCTYVLIVLVGMMIPCGEISAEKEVTIYLRSNGVHTDICLPVNSETVNWNRIFPLADFKDSTRRAFIGIGWGDKGFFLNTPTWAELKFSTAFNAIFLPSGTAMHVEYMDAPKTSEKIKTIQISKKRYSDLVKFIRKSFAYKNKRLQLIKGKGYWGRDNFYEASGKYHLFNTCNVWTNEALKSANIRTSIFSALPEGNLLHL